MFKFCCMNAVLNKGTSLEDDSGGVFNIILCCCVAVVGVGVGVGVVRIMSKR
jgi:hypothetical protein